jgi:hypothetical protein
MANSLLCSLAVRSCLLALVGLWRAESESIGDQGLIIICYVTNKVSMLRPQCGENREY